MLSNLLDYILLGESKKKINLTINDLPTIVFTRLDTYLLDPLFKIELSIDQELRISILEIERSNYIRNIFILQTAFEVDNILQDFEIKRVWLKGISDVYTNPFLMKTRKLGDNDILVDDAEAVRNILLEFGYKHFAIDIHNDNNRVTVPYYEMKQLEKDLYFLFPFTKIIRLPNFMSKLDPNILKYFRIFKDNEGYFTDSILDVHHALTFDLTPEWTMRSGEFFPTMFEIDELWYLINKSYYEVIEGDSIDLQLLVLTLFKLRKSKFDIRKVAKRMSKTEFLNEEGINFLYGLCENCVDKELYKDFKDRFISKVNKKVPNNI